MQVTWSRATSPVLERNITEVVPTSLRLNTLYIEVNTQLQNYTNTNRQNKLISEKLHSLKVFASGLIFKGVEGYFGLAMINDRATSIAPSHTLPLTREESRN